MSKPTESSDDRQLQEQADELERLIDPQQRAVVAGVSPELIFLLARLVISLVRRRG